MDIQIRRKYDEHGTFLTPPKTKTLTPAENRAKNEALARHYEQQRNQQKAEAA